MKSRAARRDYDLNIPIVDLLRSFMLTPVLPDLTFTDRSLVRRSIKERSEDFDVLQSEVDRWICGGSDGVARDTPVQSESVNFLTS